jgi:hypothetical protein
MNLPEELTAPIRDRLKSEASLSDPGIEEIMNGLGANTPINWNLLLNKELKATETDETND